MFEDMEKCSSAVLFFKIMQELFLISWNDRRSKNNACNCTLTVVAVEEENAIIL